MKIGIDIQQIAKVKSLVGTPRMQRIFSEYELSYIEKKNFAPRTIAGLYCAKEAYFKALGTGVIHNQLNKVEVLHDELGAPYLNLPDKSIKTTLSISHTKSVAVAVVIIIEEFND